MNQNATAYALQFRQFAAFGEPALSVNHESARLRGLLKFVLDHDCAIDPEIRDGAIWATFVYVDAQQVAHERRERVGSTLSECRVCLGY